jgi:peptidyl-tRNA hydrolase, PTH1 family
LAKRHGASLKGGRNNALADEISAQGKRLALAIPLTYYNESGLAVSALYRRHGLDDPEQLVVVHDELDLPVGRIKLKQGGGLAGNNGLRSIKNHLHTDAFLRVRIGVGKPPGRMEGADHVLRRPGKGERAELDVAIEEAADAVEAILTEGVEAAMTRFNQRD